MDITLDADKQDNQEIHPAPNDQTIRNTSTASNIFPRYPNPRWITLPPLASTAVNDVISNSNTFVGTWAPSDFARTAVTSVLELGPEFEATT